LPQICKQRGYFNLLIVCNEAVRKKYTEERQKPECIDIIEMRFFNKSFHEIESVLAVSSMHSKLMQRKKSFHTHKINDSQLRLNPEI
jgi:hypothetical protein